MNAIAARRSPVIRQILKYDQDFDLSYDGQLESLIGQTMSGLLGEDHRENHAYFVMFLSREGSTPNTFLNWFDGKKEALNWMLWFYKCTQLKEEIRQTSILLKKERILASFVEGIEERTAAYRALNLPMFY